MTRSRGGDVLGTLISATLAFSTVMLADMLLPGERDLEIIEFNSPFKAQYDQASIRPPQVARRDGAQGPTSTSPDDPESLSSAPPRAAEEFEGGRGWSPEAGTGESADDEYLNDIHEAFESTRDELAFLRRYGTLATRVLGSEWRVNGTVWSRSASSVSEPFFSAYRRISGINLRSPSPMSIRYSRPRDQLVQVLAYRGGTAVRVMGGESLGLAPFDPRGMAQVLAGGVGRRVQFRELTPEQQSALVEVCREWDLENRKAKRKFWTLLRPIVNSRIEKGRENSDIAAIMIRDSKMFMSRNGEDSTLDGLLIERERLAVAMRTTLRRILEN